MKQKLLNLWLLTVMIIVGSSGAWAYTPTLTADYTVPGYKLKTFYNISGTNVSSICPESGDFRFRGGGYGLFNYGSGNRGADLNIAVAANDILIFEFKDSQGRSVTINSVSNCTKRSSITDYLGFDVTTAASTVNVNVGRAGCIIAILHLEKDNSVATANYTVKFVDANDAEILNSTSISGVINASVDISGLKTSIYTGGKKYIYVSDDADGKTIASDGSTVVTIKFRDAATYSYTVNTKAGDATDLLASGTTFEGDAVTVPFSQYVLKGTTLYNIAAGSGDWYRVTFTPTANNYVHDLNYNGATIPNVVFFSEGEAVSGVSVANNTARASNGQMGYTANENTYKEVTTLAPGRYKIFGRGVNGNSAARTANFKLGESTTVWSFNIPNGTNTLGNSEEFDANNEVLSMACTGSSASGLDWLYVQRTGDAPAPAILAKKAELSGNLNENISAKLEGNTLTIKALKDGFGITKVKLLASELGTVTANAGTVEKGVWTGNAKEVVLTLDGTDLNSVSINGAEVPEGTGAATISEFKTAANADYLTLSGADILDFPAEGGVIVQDDEAGILLNITLPAVTGKKITGKVYGTYDANALVSSDYTDCTQPNTSAGNWREPKEMTVEDAIKAANVYRLVVLKGVTIDENNGVFTATDKTGAVITVNPAMLTLVKGDVLASLTGVTYPDGKMKATEVQSGLLWKADDLAAGQSLPVNMTDAAYVSKLADVAMGDVIAIETQGAGTLDVQNAAGQSIVKLEMTQNEDKTLHFPVTADVVSDIQKHGLVLAGEGMKAVMAYKVPGMYAANMNENTIWYSNDVFAQTDRVTLGAIHFPDVREGDELGGVVLTADAAAAQQDQVFDATGKAEVKFVKKAVRDDKAEAVAGEEFTAEDYQQTNGMIMTFGGLTGEETYSFDEVYPAVNKFAAVTEGIDKFPVDDDNKAYDPAQKNVPTQGTFYVFNPTKDGQIDVTVELEKDKKLYVTEDGEALKDFNGITKVTDNMISFPVKAGKTYFVFANETNLKYYGFTFTPTDANAQDLAKNIDVFKKLAAGTEAKLMLEDAVVTYIKGDNVFVEDASGAIDFFETQIQFYVGQKINGYIIGENNLSNNMPVLLRTSNTPNSKFTAEKGTAQSKKATVAEVKQENGLARFVTLKKLQLAKDKLGLRILIDEAGDTIYVEDHFNVLYELPNKVKAVEGIVGTNAEGTRYIWPTSKDAIVPAGVPATLETGKYYLKNVGSGLFWGAGNDWGTRGSLLKHAEYVTLIAQGNGIYQMESQVSNGGTAYYFEGDYMDNANPMSLTISKIDDVYTIASPDDKLFGYDGTSTVLGKNVADGENAQWQIISEDEMKATLDDATADNGVDATFLILDPNFGRNNRNVGAWTMANEGVAYNLSGGNNINNCAESYMSTFVLAQEVSVPNGKYVLNAQAAVTFHDDRVIKDYDGNGYPQITANDQVSDFKEMETDDRLSNMGRLSEQFTAGKYAVEPITVYVTDGKLTIGAKSERNDIWAIWDNFELTYYGPATDPDALSSVLVHTASSSCAGDANVYVSTVDAEKEHVNNEKFNAAWQGAAYAEFAFSVPAGQTVTNATFKFTAIGESRRARPAIVYCVDAGLTLDYAAMAAGDQKVNLAGTKVADITFPHNTSELLEVDVTEALKSMIAAGQNYIIFKVTGNPGGGDMNGKGSENLPELVITTDQATGIDNVQTAARVFEDGVVYNLKGQKVGDSLQGLKKGLYIINGRKVVVK